MLKAAGIGSFDADGIDLAPAFAGGAVPDRALYAESFAPLLDFGWSPLRTIRSGGWKYIAAPQPELYHLSDDPAETREPDRVGAAARRGPGPASRRDFHRRAAGLRYAPRPRFARRLQALGYVSGRTTTGARADPKDRRVEAARLAEITSGELHGGPLEQALRAVLKEDADNPQANVRLGYMLMEGGRCGEAAPHFNRAIANHFPTADAHLGLAGCQIAAKDLIAAERTLRQGDALEPDNPGRQREPRARPF